MVEAWSTASKVVGVMKTGDELTSLHRDLCGNSHRREAASTELASLDLDEMERIVRIEVGQRTVRSKRLYRVSVVAGLVAYGSLASLRWFHWPWLSTILISIMLVSNFALWGLIWQLNRRGSRTGIADVIEQSQDPAFVPAALTLLSTSPALRKSFSSQSGPVEQRLRRVLTSQLPKMTPESTVGWTEAQRRGLLVPLHEPTFDPDLTIQALRVTAFAGNSSALKTVKDLTRLKGHRSAERIRIAATGALAILEDRLAQNAIPERLLRAAESPTSNDLLRVPAISNSDESDKLLRVPAEQT